MTFMLVPLRPYGRFNPSILAMMAPAGNPKLRSRGCCTAVDLRWMPHFRYTYFTCASMTGRICGAAGLVGRKRGVGCEGFGVCDGQASERQGEMDGSNLSVSV